MPAYLRAGRLGPARKRFFASPGDAGRLLGHLGISGAGGGLPYRLSRALPTHSRLLCHRSRTCGDCSGDRPFLRPERHEFLRLPGLLGPGQRGGIRRRRVRRRSSGAEDWRTCFARQCGRGLWRRGGGLRWPVAARLWPAACGGMAEACGDAAAACGSAAFLLRI